MLKINWEEYKQYKKHRLDINNNFLVLLEFIKSYYNMISPVDIFEILKNDELAEMMLEKRGIEDAEGLEKYLFKQCRI